MNKKNITGVINVAFTAKLCVTALDCAGVANGNAEHTSLKESLMNFLVGPLVSQFDFMLKSHTVSPAVGPFASHHKKTAPESA